jgi:hypothetical protein
VLSPEPPRLPVHRDPEVMRACKPLIDGLTGVDESRRLQSQTAVAGMPGGLRVHIAHMLVDALLLPAARTRARAVSSLAAIGRPAIPAIFGGLQAGKGPRVRADLLGAVALLAPGLAPEDRADLIMRLIISGLARDERPSVRAAFREAVSALKSPDAPREPAQAA